MSSDLVMYSYDTACQSSALQNIIARKKLFWLFFTLYNLVEDFFYFNKIQSKEVACHTIFRKKRERQVQFLASSPLIACILMPEELRI